MWVCESATFHQCRTGMSGSDNLVSLAVCRETCGTRPPDPPLQRPWWPAGTACRLRPGQNPAYAPLCNRSVFQNECMQLNMTCEWALPPGCQLRPGQPVVYKAACEATKTAAACLRLNLTCVWRDQASPQALKSDDSTVMPHLEIPTFPPQWNLSRSTMTQLCFGPTPLGGEPLNNETGRFLRKWGVIEIDFESEVRFLRILAYFGLDSVYLS